MRKVTVCASRSYDVLIEKGILGRAGELCLSVTAPSVAVIVTDTNVAPLYLDTVKSSLENSGFETREFIISAGEEQKNAQNYLALLSFMATGGVTRSDVIIALGGGVVGDLAGFAAATYMRGTKFVQIPTTLLSMVDSSVGGKTAIDTPEGKNIVGAFYQPSLVICDPNVLNTLTDAILNDGYAEVLKYGIIGDIELWNALKSAPIMSQIEEIIQKCVSNKRDLVEADERDEGVRHLLNLGHTPAHAIEILSDFTVSHGNAVAMGIVIMARAAAKMGLCPECDVAEIIELLTAYGLPTACPFAASELAKIASSDKKRDRDKISVVLPHGIGKCEIHNIHVGELESLFSLGL